MDTRPIGVFDSGLGGLTAVRQLRRLLPGEDIVYFGDTGRVPYGSRGARCDRAVRPAGYPVPAFPECQVHYGGLRHSIFHLSFGGICPAAGTLHRCDRCGSPRSCCRHQKQTHRRDRHSGHHPQRFLCHPAERSGARGFRFLPAPAPCLYRWLKTVM